MDEQLEGLLWLISKVTGNSTIMGYLTGGFHPAQAPLGTLPIYGTILPGAGNDVSGVSGYRKMYDGPYDIRFWGYASQSDELQAAVNALDAMLMPGGRPSAGTSPDGLAQIILCIREHPLPLLPEWDGQQLRISVGALWRCQIQNLGA
jgi:hypothetical protein